jgi:hypothetical protein
VVGVVHPDVGEYLLFCEGAPPLRFTENETNSALLFGGENASPWVKDGINDFVVQSRAEAVNPELTGTKATADHDLILEPGETRVIRLRLVQGSELTGDPFGPGFDDVLTTRRVEADAFYETIVPDGSTDDEKAVMRQALAGMLWSKQYYALDQEAWLAGRDEAARRNLDWSHLKASDVISMPDKWEYPWFAVWDLAFHALSLMLVDVDFTKLQLSMFLEDRYQRADGAIPAYEWNFSDVNPPVHAYATLRVYQFEKAHRHGQGDVEFLSWMFERLGRNYEWWVQRKSVDGEDVFHGGFLGLDNIGVFDRSSALPTGGHLEQSDGTAWMVLYAQTMLSMALELSRNDPSYEERALYFFDQVVTIAAAVDKLGDNEDEIWDEEDGFFYDVLRFPDGRATRLKIRSLVGLLMMAAVTVFESQTLAALPRLRERLHEVACGEIGNFHCPAQPGHADRRMLAILDEDKLRRVLSRVLDEDEFLSPYGIRSMSRHHLENPYVFHWEGEEHVVRYLPAESDSSMFGGNSNWRGPIWMPPNYLMMRALLQLYSFYGDAFTIECPTGSGRSCTLFEVAQELGRRVTGILLPDDEGRRPVFGGVDLFQNDPHWRDHLLFFEYFHGDNGAGVGASHQTGWTGMVATIMSTLGRLVAADFKVTDEQGRAKMLVGTDGRARPGPARDPDKSG